ncbi:unknown [Firmicutes bacterium CAG:449]|nr:unknown [Firmicutes bacterium CAG:449]
MTSLVTFLSCLLETSLVEIYTSILEFLSSEVKTVFSEESKTYIPSLLRDIEPVNAS